MRVSEATPFAAFLPLLHIQIPETDCHGWCIYKFATIILLPTVHRDDLDPVPQPVNPFLSSPFLPYDLFHTRHMLLVLKFAPYLAVV